MFVLTLTLTLSLSVIARLLLELDTASEAVQRESFFNLSFDILISTVGILIGSHASTASWPYVLIIAALFIVIFFSVIMPVLFQVNSLVTVWTPNFIAAVTYFISARKA